jgi:large subunit ribosomal protein L32e
MAVTKQTKTTKGASKSSAGKSGANLLTVKRQLRRSRPVFKRHGSHRKAELSDRWKKPRGLHNKLKDNKRGCGPVVGDGYRTPKAVRGMHISGLSIVRVANVKELQGIDTATQGIVIAGIGAKKQLEILAEASKRGIRVLNHQLEKRISELKARAAKVKEEREETRASKKAKEAKETKASSKDKKADAAAESAESDDEKQGTRSVHARGKEVSAEKAVEEKAKKEVLTSKNQ